MIRLAVTSTLFIALLWGLWSLSSFGREYGISTWANPTIDLAGFEFTKRPSDWQDRQAAELSYRRRWCERRDLEWSFCVKAPNRPQKRARELWCDDADISDCEDWFSRAESEFQVEWQTYRSEYISALNPPSLPRSDFRSANLFKAFLAGADLSAANLEGAILIETRMEEVDLSEARMEGANLSGAQIEEANLGRARMEGADLRRARMVGADLFETQLEGADLSEARLEGAFLWKAQMVGANLARARLMGANLTSAQLMKADLSEARMQGADLFGTRMQGADLTRAWMEGANSIFTSFSSANFNGVTIGASPLNGSNLAGATGLSQAMLAKAVGDVNTVLPLDADGKQIFVMSCWANKPSTWDVIQKFPNYLVDFSSSQLLCPPGEKPRRTGRTECGVEITDDNWDKPELLKCPEE